jgi:hypothetical protein
MRLGFPFAPQLEAHLWLVRPPEVEPTVAEQRSNDAETWKLAKAILCTSAPELSVSATAQRSLRLVRTD